MSDSTPVKFIISPHRINSMMTGVRYAQWQAGRVTLVYVNGTKESAICHAAEWAQGCENFFSLVGTIQNRARQSLPHQL